MTSLCKLPNTFHYKGFLWSLKSAHTSTVHGRPLIFSVEDHFGLHNCLLFCPLSFPSDLVEYKALQILISFSCFRKILAAFQKKSIPRPGFATIIAARIENTVLETPERQWWGEESWICLPSQPCKPQTKHIAQMVLPLPGGTV